MALERRIYDKIYEDGLKFQESLGLKRGADRSMILLKGHLLIEELLELMISRMVPRPDELAEAHLTFYQRLCLARALRDPTKEPDSDWVWSVVKKLNSLRNLMVHDLAPKEFDEKLDEFSDEIESHMTGAVLPGTGEEYQMARLGLSLSGLNVVLSKVVRAHTEAVSGQPTC